MNIKNRSFIFVELRLAAALGNLVRRDIATGDLVRAARRQRLSWLLMRGVPCL